MGFGARLGPSMLKPAPRQHARTETDCLVHNFERQIAGHKLSAFNETQTRRDFLDPWLAALGWDTKNHRNLPQPLREGYLAAGAAPATGRRHRAQPAAAAGHAGAPRRRIPGRPCFRPLWPDGGRTGRGAGRTGWGPTRTGCLTRPTGSGRTPTPGLIERTSSGPTRTRWVQRQTSSLAGRFRSAKKPTGLPHGQTGWLFWVSRWAGRATLWLCLYWVCPGRQSVPSNHRKRPGHRAVCVSPKT